MLLGGKFITEATSPNTTNVFLSKDCCQGRTSPGRRVRASCHGSLCRGLGQSCELVLGRRAPRDSSRADPCAKLSVSFRITDIVIGDLVQVFCHEQVFLHS